MTTLQLFTVIDITALIAGLEGAVVNTAGLKGLKVTIASATAIVDGLNRGRTKLGG